MLSSNISSTCPHNMVNFGPLAAEIISLVWGTPGNFNGFRVLAVLLHGTLVVGVSQTASLNRGRHLYSARRPSRWASAHISSVNLECRSEMWCTRLAEKHRMQKSRQKSPSGHHRTTLSGYIFAIKARIDNRKKLVKHQYLLHMST